MVIREVIRTGKRKKKAWKRMINWVMLFELVCDEKFLSLLEFVNPLTIRIPLANFWSLKIL